MAVTVLLVPDSDASDRAVLKERGECWDGCSCDCCDPCKEGLKALCCHCYSILWSQYECVCVCVCVCACVRVCTTVVVMEPDMN